MLKNILQITILLGFIGIAASCGNANQDEENPSEGEDKLYTKLTAEETGIDFSNRLHETLQLNYYQFQYLYNGGGVAVGDINNDGLEDIYFSATQFSNKLYLNQGNLKFKDITQEAGVLVGEGIKTGVTMVDINNDGFLDIYVCRTGPEADGAKRSNQFFINNGNLTFTESAEKMGLKEQCFSNHATFFDYDKDGDLDMYLLNHPTNFKKESNPRVVLVNGAYRRISTPENQHEGDRLYRNNGNNTFTDVSKTAGIINRAFGLSVGISDFNNDGFDDIFVANDYSEPDILYINNQDGTFTDELDLYFRHTSAHSMGSDVADLNNDGLMDMIALDMLAEDNRRQKALGSIMTYNRFQEYVKKGFGHQLMRNVLQLNNGNNTFSEISEMAGIAATDWSWGALAADYDNDGWKDIFIANGCRRDVTNNDFTMFTKSKFKTQFGPNDNIYDNLNLIPSEKVRNYMYKNNHDLTFKNVGYDWGVSDATYSNGTAYADLDNDGDLDLIVNNIDEVAFIYKNDAAQLAKNHYLQIQFDGTANNKKGIGAKVTLAANGNEQTQELRPTRGFFSSMPYVLHFGTGAATSLDLVKIEWADGKTQTLTNIKADQRLTIKYSDAQPAAANKKTFTPIFTKTDLAALAYQHQENTDFIDFKREPLLPHELSKEGPSLAVGDVNGDGKEDVFVGGAMGTAGVLYLQEGSSFGEATAQPWQADSPQEDVGALFFDADGDKDLDLYVVSGGNAAPKDAAVYQDRLYTNDGKGNFTKATDALPSETSSGSCVTAADYDGDGDLDLFVGGRVMPAFYPYAPQSFIFQNNGGKFTDVTATVSVELSKIGMVKDAIWADINKDKKPDLIVVGEWMAVTVFINNNGKLENATEKWGLAGTKGWWNTVEAADMDGDGDLDLVVGNLGLNTRMKATPSQPLEVIAKDFDNNSSTDAVVSKFYQNNQYPIYQRGVLMSQMPYLQQRFNRYEPYANATTSQVFTVDELSGVLKLQATTMTTAYFENTGNGFKMKALPNLAQISPTQALALKDFDKDGKMDILLVGNFYYNEVETARYDAGNGLLLKGDGKGNFKPLSVRQSGFFAAKDARDLKIMKYNGRQLVIVANNNDKLESFVW